MKTIFLFFLSLTFTNWANASKEPSSNGIVSKDSTRKDKHICNCFFGNEEEYEFMFPDD